MKINPAHLLLLMLIFVFAPSIHAWITQGETAWYRPYIVWLLTIVFVYWSQRGKRLDEF
jgi:hypothetical protein